MRKAISSIVALILLAAIVITFGIGSSWFTNGNISTWFNSWGTGGTAEEDGGSEEDDGSADSGGLIVSDSDGSGITLLSAVLPVAAYAANGVSASADTAYVITATVGADNSAENTGVSWSLAWADESSAWASGKSVSDYVTVTPSGDDYVSSKTATVVCLQAFGEQIVLTATAQENSALTASCTLDYSQRLENVALSFGGVDCVFGGETPVTLELSASGEPYGGAASLALTQGDVYTIAQTFTASYSLALPSAIDYSAFLLADICSGTSSWGLAFGTYDPDSGVSASAAFSSYSVADSGLYFGLQYFADYMGLRECYSVSSSGLWSDYDLYAKSASSTWGNVCDVLLSGSSSYSDGAFTHSCFGGNLFTLTVSLSSAYSDYTYSTDFVMGSYTNLTALTSIELDRTSIVF